MTTAPAFTTVDGRRLPVRTPDNPRGLRDLPFPVPHADEADRRRARLLMAALERAYPDAHCELTWRAPHELLVATILSAQTTDAGVNRCTPALFGAFPTPHAFAGATPAQIEPHIRSIGLFRNKARAVHEAMARVVSEYGGEVPRTVGELLTLRGVARKTAGVVLGNCFGINDVFVVDTHVQRLSYRFGFTDDPKTPTDRVERRLMSVFPRARWCDLSHFIIWHGRRASPARGWDPTAHPIDRRFAVHTE